MLEFFFLSLSHSLVCRATRAFLLHMLSSLSLSPYQTQAFLRLKLLLKPPCDSMYIYTSPLLHIPSLFQIFMSCLFQFLLVWNFHSLPFSLSCWWLWSSDGCAPAMVVGYGLWFDGPMVVVDGVIWFCGSLFVGLSSWVWVSGSRFVDHRRDQHGSSSWPMWIVNLISMVSVDHRLDRCGSLIVVVAGGQR